MPVVAAHSGTVLSQMQLVTLTFDGYARTDDVARFSDVLVGSTWYRSIGALFGMSPATHAQHLSLGPAPTSLSHAAIATLVSNFVAASSEVIKPADHDNEVLYLLYVPDTVAREPDLAAVHGYHQVVDSPNVPTFPLAVVLDSGEDLAHLTIQASHQVINAATNPYDRPFDGYYTDPPMTDPWSLLRGEIADLCAGEDPYLEQGYEFARVYSTIEALASRPPCKPELPNDVWSDVTAEPGQIQHIKVTPTGGGTARFQLTGWSTHPIPDWKISVHAAPSSQFSDDEMQIHLTSDVINNNVTVTLSLRAPPEARSGMVGAVSVLSGANRRPWVVGFSVD